jgi:hypothetical protein
MCVKIFTLLHNTLLYNLRMLIYGDCNITSNILLLEIQL